MDYKRLTRSATDKKLFGVCGGIAEYAGVDTTLIRIIMVCILFFTAIIPGLLLYSIIAIVMPEA